jgi:hypothetical protein
VAAVFEKTLGIAYRPEVQWCMRAGRRTTAQQAKGGDCTPSWKAHTWRDVCQAAHQRQQGLWTQPASLAGIGWQHDRVQHKQCCCSDPQQQQQHDGNSSNSAGDCGIITIIIISSSSTLRCHRNGSIIWPSHAP